MEDADNEFLREITTMNQLPKEISQKIAEFMDTETLGVTAFSFYEHKRVHGPYSTQLMGRIERLRVLCTILRDTSLLLDFPSGSLHSMLIDPSHILPYNDDKAYWNERDFRRVAETFMEAKLFPAHVIVYVAAMWGYTDYAEKLVKDDELLQANECSPYQHVEGCLKKTMAHGAGMGGYVAFKEQEIENDLSALERYSAQLGQSPDSLEPDAQDIDPPELVCSWVMVYMHGLICRGKGLSSEGRQRVDALLARFNKVESLYHPSGSGQLATSIAVFAALLSGDTHYADALRPSIIGKEEFELFELLAVLQLRREQEAKQILDDWLRRKSDYLFLFECLFMIAVRQQLNDFVQSYLDSHNTHIEYHRQEIMDTILRHGSDDFIARLGLGDVKDAKKQIDQEVQEMKDSSPHVFETLVMHMDALRVLQLRYGPDADMDGISKKADRLAFARITQQRPRRSEKTSDEQDPFATTALCEGLALAVAEDASGVGFSR